MKRSFVLAALLFAGCDSTGTGTTCDSGDVCGESGDTETGDVFVPANDISLDWDRVDSGGAVSISIVNSGATGFYLGFAETASGGAGWYGEDCGSQGDCHQFNSTSGSLDYVETIGAVSMGSSTLFDGGSDGAGDAFTSNGADRLTYIIQLSGGAYDTYCYVWGDDISYYSGDGCDSL